MWWGSAETLRRIGWGVVGLLLLLRAWRGLEWLWWRPRRLERALRSQGLRGTQYRFLHGDLKENARLNKEAWSKPMPLSHDIVPRVAPFFHRAIEENEDVKLLAQATKKKRSASSPRGQGKRVKIIAHKASSPEKGKAAAVETPAPSRRMLILEDSDMEVAEISVKPVPLRSINPEETSTPQAGPKPSEPSIGKIPEPSQPFSQAGDFVFPLGKPGCSIIKDWRVAEAMFAGFLLPADAEVLQNETFRVQRKVVLSSYIKISHYLNCFIDYAKESKPIIKKANDDLASAMKMKEEAEERMKAANEIAVGAEVKIKSADDKASKAEIKVKGLEEDLSLATKEAITAKETIVRYDLEIQKLGRVKTELEAKLHATEASLQGAKKKIKAEEERNQNLASESKLAVDEAIRTFRASEELRHEKIKFSATAFISGQDVIHDKVKARYPDLDLSFLDEDEDEG